MKVFIHSLATICSKFLFVDRVGLTMTLTLIYMGGGGGGSSFLLQLKNGWR